MQILKKIVVALAVIFVIAAVVIYFLPNHFEITNSIEINKPAGVVQSQVADFNKWIAWGPWMQMEPNAKYTFEGTPGTPGHKMNWEGEKLGMGSMTLVLADESSVKTQLEFIKPFKSEGRDIWTFEDAGGITKATWTSKGGLKYPMGRIFGLMMDKMLGDTERHGLDNLKKLCESLPEPPPPPSIEVPVDSTAAI